MIEGRDGEDDSGAKCMQPSEVCKGIPLVFDVANSIGLLVGSVRYLVVISSQRSNQPQLIRWCLVENERGETTDSRSLVVKILRVGSFEPEVRAVAGNAPIPRETIGVIAEADLVVCVVVAAITRDQFSLAAS